MGTVYIIAIANLHCMHPYSFFFNSASLCCALFLLGANTLKAATVCTNNQCADSMQPVATAHFSYLEYWDHLER